MNPPKIRLDWRAYFQEFRRVHGDPVPFKGRLLFQDGWMYSATDRKGPEWPPPADPEQAWKLRYAWASVRQQALKRRVRELRELVGALEQAAHQRSACLQQKVRTRGEDGLWQEQTRPLDIPAMQADLEVWEAELKDADALLEALLAEPEADPRMQPV